MMSDNGGQFVLANKTMNELKKDLIAEELALKRIEWKFLPSLSPWAGGLYERLVGMAKTCFKRALGRKILEYDQLVTFTAEVEASLNQRPISHVSGESDAPLPLRPIDFLIPHGTISLNFDSAEEWVDERRLPPEKKLALIWKNTLTVLDTFWEKWSSEYLILLRERSKWNHKGPRLQTMSSPTVGEVVLVEEDFRPRNLWPLGKVMELNASGSVVRSVKIKMANGRIVTRPVSRLYPLEVKPVEEETNEKEIESKKKINENLACELESKKDENPPQNKPTVEKQAVKPHPMVTRAKAKLATITLVALCFLCLLNNATALAIKSCSICLIHCTLTGVMVFGPIGNQKMEICCDDMCVIRNNVQKLSYELPTEMLLTDYHCVANFWKSSREMFSTEMTCPALNECLLMDCTFCIDLLVNPSCNPSMASVLWAVITLTILIGVCTLLTFCRSCHQNFRMIVAIGRMGCQCWRWMKRKTAYTRARARETIRNKKESLRIRGRQWRREGFAKVTRLVTIMILIGAVPGGNASQTISIMSKSETCHRGQTGIHCVVNQATTLTLLPAGQSNTLMIRDEHGIVLGTLTIILNALTVECVAKSEGWLRSYKVESSSNFRCPRAANSSCFSNFCGQVKPDDKIWELKEVNHLPGHTFCADSLGSWAKGCALWPANGCLFYRFYGQPVSKTIFEKISCPTWKFRIQAQLKLERNSIEGEVHSTDVFLHPGMKFEWHNVTVTPLMVAVPPAPVLNSNFIHSNGAVALVGNLNDDLHCESEQQALDFNCSLAGTACTSCSPDHETGTIGCSCRDLSLEEILEDPQQRLPLPVGHFHLKNENTRIFADTGYSPVQLNVEMKNVEMVLQLKDSKCWLEVTNFTGCYKCLTGAQLLYRCKTDWGQALAKIECDDGLIFTAKCNMNSTEQREILNVQESRIKTKCLVDCPAGITEFELEGELYYVPQKRRRPQYRRSEKLESPNTSFSLLDFNFDPFALYRMLLNPKALILFFFVLVIGIVGLILFIKLNPAFMVYKTIIGVLTAKGENSLPNRFLVVLILFSPALSAQVVFQTKA
uniref:Integrase catalytic domain-containing protein n=1 Tax=Meloidogyne incognita TaxID=6306 RepID=A0A914LLL5_MELIC